jgi:hypothetical protein
MTNVTMTLGGTDGRSTRGSGAPSGASKPSNRMRWDVVGARSASVTRSVPSDGSTIPGA